MTCNMSCPPAAGDDRQNTRTKRKFTCKQNTRYTKNSSGRETVHSQTGAHEPQHERTPLEASRSSLFLELQSHFGDNPLKFQVGCPQIGTAVLKGLVRVPG